MEQFISQNPGVIIVIFAGLFALMGWLIKMGVADSQEKIKKHTSEIKVVFDRTTEIEKNYKQEFKIIREKINDSHLETIGMMSEVREDIAELKGYIKN